MSWLYGQYIRFTIWLKHRKRVNDMKKNDPFIY
jgi:hypothetical protein